MGLVWHHVLSTERLQSSQGIYIYTQLLTYIRNQKQVWTCILIGEGKKACVLFPEKREYGEREFSPLPLSPGKQWKRTKIKAQRSECWFYYLEAEKQLVKASLESSLLLGPKASVEEAVHLTHKGVWAFVPGLHHARFAHACFDVNSSSWWCMVVLVWGGGEREEYGKMGASFSHTTPLTTRRKMQYLACSGSPLNVCSSANSTLPQFSQLPLSKEVLRFTSELQCIRKDG